MTTSSVDRSGFRNWLLLLGLQLALASLVLGPFLAGSRYFAFLDIGSDTYGAFVGHAMHMARQFASEGWTGWSFNIGLGAPTAWLLGDPFILLTQLGGADHVLELRAWVYLLKLVLAGSFFFWMVRPLVRRAEPAIIMALSYTFCGFAVTNGQWDPEATSLMMFPLVLGAVIRHLRQGGLLAIPLCVAAALYGGVFFVTLGVSLAVACAACVALSAHPRTTLRLCLTRVLPLAGAGYLLAAPYLLPAALQLLDSPRVGGSHSLMAGLVADGLRLSDVQLLLAQLGGLLHKNIFGIGDAYSGYMNYLEGPGFYVSTLALLAIPQLLRGEPADRRAFWVGACAAALYLAVPAFRLAAYGFASPYFRSSCLWITLAIALLGARALDLVFSRGVDRRLLAGAAAALCVLLGLLAWATGPYLSWTHAGKVLILAAATAIVLLTAGRGMPAKRLAAMLLVIAAADAAWMARPSYFEGRRHATADQQPLRDETVEALAALRRFDPSPYRVEKTFHSYSLAEAMAQDYMGVKSYYYHGSAVVDLHRQMDMVNPAAGGPNDTNWLLGPGDRFMLHSALGVKYLVSRRPLDLPGFEQVLSGEGWRVYRNNLALPFGVVHSKQTTRAAVAALDGLPAGQSRLLREAILLNAAVLDQFLPGAGKAYDPRSLPGAPGLEALYERPARALRRNGLEVTSFSSKRIAGRVRAEEDGVLVFSIPHYRGWSLRIDGQPVPLVRAQYGLMGAAVAAGPHEVELDYTLPGRREGWLLALAGALLLGLAFTRTRSGRDIGG